MKEVIVRLTSDHIKVKGGEYVQDLVRCGECKHMTADGRCLEFADDALRPSASDFCSYGERKDQ